MRRFRVIYERSFTLSMEMSFLQGTWRCLFLLCPWPRPGLQGLNVTLKMPYSLRTRKVILNVAPPDPVPVSGRGGQALYILDICPENRDESNGNSIVRLWLQFIPIFGALHSQLCKGHITKKDIPMFLICIASP
jgi:hypothetical protein